jgi:hypothetical protein
MCPLGCGSGTTMLGARMRRKETPCKRYKLDQFIGSLMRFKSAYKLSFIAAN